MSEIIKKEDYKNLISEQLLEQLISNNPNILDDLENIVLDEIKPYLVDYNLDDFIKNPDANKFLKMRIMDIVMYHLYSRLSAKEIPEVKISRYHEALKWLEKIQNNEITLTIPKIQNSNKTIKYGSREKQNFFI